MQAQDLKPYAYIGAILTDKAHQEALALWRNYVPTLQNIYCHHVTLQFNPKKNMDAVERLLPWMGQYVDIEVTGMVAGFRDSAIDAVQAFVCKLPEGLYCSNAHPHITVSTGNDDNGKKIPPSTSNKLLEDPGILCRPIPTTILKARIGLAPHRKEQDILYSIFKEARL